MPTLTIKGIPQDLYRRLKTQAESHRRSLNSEIIVCLERSVATGAVSAETWLENVETFRKRVGVKPLSQSELKAAKTTGRR